MAIKIGNLDINAFKVGNSDPKIYLGDALLYPTTPPSLQGKWLATYSDSSILSAECGSSSEIVRNEINLTNLVSVEIGDCATIIGFRAFGYCYSLTSIDIPSSVTNIGEQAFIACSGLTSIDIPNGVTTIGRAAFNNCSSLTSIDIPSGVTSIGASTFYGCSSLTSIDIPNSVTSIGNSAFNNCDGLTSCTIGSGVTSISDRAFYNCSGLTSITCNAIVPPTLEGESRWFDNTNNCPIYVPAESVNAYKSASGWRNYASRIVPKH